MKLKKDLTKIVTTIIVIAFIITYFVYVNNSDKTNNIHQQSKIKVGVLIPLTGNFAFVGEEVKEVLENANHDNIEFVFEDTACDNNIALSAYTKLSEMDDINYFIGPLCGSPQEIIANQISNKQNIVILPSAAPQELFDKSNEKAFQTFYSLEYEAKKLAEYMNGQNIKKVAIIEYNNKFSKTCSDEFQKDFNGNYTKLVLDYTISDVQNAMLKIKEYNPDAIYISDSSFFFLEGMSNLDNYNIDVDVYSNYVIQMDVVKALAENVKYTFPKDEKSNNNLSQIQLNTIEALNVYSKAFSRCDDQYTCIKDYIDKESLFNDKGFITKDIGIYQIQEGKEVLVE